MITCPKCLREHEGRYQNTSGGKQRWCTECHREHNAMGIPAYDFAYKWFQSVGLAPRMRPNTLDMIKLMTVAYETKTGQKWPMPLLHNRTLKTVDWSISTGLVSKRKSNRISTVYPRSSYNPPTAQSTEDEVFLLLQKEHPYPRVVVSHTENGAVAVGFDFSVYLDGKLIEVNEAKTNSTKFTPREVAAIIECEKLGVPYFLNIRRRRVQVFPNMLRATGEMELAGRIA